MHRDKKALERKCVQLFGEIAGKSLFEAMIKVAEKDFCVATAWEPNQMSISISCSYRGKVFMLSQDYKHLFMPNGRGLREIDTLSNTELTKYLPRTVLKDRYQHCAHDEPGDESLREYSKELSNLKFA
ncbi:hypothetical protein A3K73_08245 [Candidatus Pacearchaeota archaeon RBG_13_36_9]|nr:MAG: hypothetical protein A3K73_08245 [Candidatus Pacearchaeota archaeon RBG_13_36_9]